MSKRAYIHGTAPEEQARLRLLNSLTNNAYLDFLEINPTDTVLEVGSGLGILANEVATRTPRGEVVGIEYSKEQLAKAKRKHSNVDFRQGDAHALPFADGHFDVVYCRYVLEHVADPLQVLKEMRRVLKPGGKTFTQECNILVNVLCPECSRFSKIWRKFARLQRQLGGDALIGKKLYILFKRAGFRKIELSVQPEIHHPELPTFKPWIENLIGNVRSGADEMQERGIATKGEIQNAIIELEEFMERDDSSAYFYWNRAKGVK